MMIVCTFHCELCRVRRRFIVRDTAFVVSWMSTSHSQVVGVPSCHGIVQNAPCFSLYQLGVSCPSDSGSRSTR